ncbi:MAG TPA: DUF3226 domain-containing protein [Candidatus Baltobacteraceae bacterium]|jgi:hypothetical protein|nr:DUF3226 domain-containing protein [Candidatus Baltobacteraceae bacterium]
MNGRKFVFCEGPDDVAVITGIVHASRISDVVVEPFQGKDKLRSFLREIQQRPEFAQNKVASIGIIRDADDDAAAAFQSVRDALISNGYAAPQANAAVTGEPIKVGVLIIAPNDRRGMLEDLCLKSVSDRPEFACVDEYFRCVAEKSERKVFSSKAKVRVWMSSHPDYDLYVGKAAEKGYWPWDTAAFEGVKTFLRSL